MLKEVWGGSGTLAYLLNGIAMMVAFAAFRVVAGLAYLYQLFVLVPRLGPALSEVGVLGALVKPGAIVFYALNVCSPIPVPVLRLKLPLRDFCAADAPFAASTSRVPTPCGGGFRYAVCSCSALLDVQNPCGCSQAVLPQEAGDHAGDESGSGRGVLRRGDARGHIPREGRRLPGEGRLDQGVRTRRMGDRQRQRALSYAANLPQGL